ncbi:hypothetical protein [Streptomyces barringtoniae]|uniref:hypothetical protein n=1 Tax=Streptomyces barringtoniae TaxID=2892029 RepID=UPI001E5939BC|nr:hypothetical protein [Streptomyces barringtoniae]MCC5474522.1 hypothetical protein [Streptomyces barringtoniae]
MNKRHSKPSASGDRFDRALPSELRGEQVDVKLVRLTNGTETVVEICIPTAAVPSVSATRAVARTRSTAPSWVSPSSATAP